MRADTHAVLCGIAVMKMAWASCQEKESSGTARDPENNFITTERIVASNIMDTADVVTAQWDDLAPDAGYPHFTKAHMKLRRNATYDVV